MDWFSWLSKTKLELTLVYDYGVVFACNELTAEDVAHFDHEFLQSMGIAVAKHRLEIIKLARSEAAAGRGKGGVSGRVRDAIERTRRRVVECARRVMVMSQERGLKTGLVKREGGEKDHQVFMLTHHSHNGQWDRDVKAGVGYRSPRMKSGPLERSGQARVRGLGSRGHSGPLDRFKVGRGASGPSGYASKKSPVVPLTPRVSGPVDAEDGIDTLWAKLFQDMKPT
uniref:SAM domain-containing protein n=1 Tax=Kalanchoe fedtschenkoi TaxID=63787 RepID=A0A7N0RA96_KALFE